MIRVLALGDVVGRPGREALERHLGELRQGCRADVVVVNAENAAGGLGIDSKTAADLRRCGVDIITLGDHAWQRKEARTLLETEKDWIVRPANFTPGAPGRGWTSFRTKSGSNLAVLNILGRVFMNTPLDCPFKTAEQLREQELKDCSVIICDIHAEATSEKEAFARYFDGKFSLIFGTHTHVPTADERILPQGTAFITDLGMTGSLSGVIGMDVKAALGRFLTGLPHAYEVAPGEGVLQGIVCEIDEDTGKPVSIRRVCHPARS